MMNFLAESSNILDMLIVVFQSSQFFCAIKIIYYENFAWSNISLGGPELHTYCILKVVQIGACASRESAGIRTSNV